MVFRNLLKAQGFLKRLDVGWPSLREKRPLQGFIQTFCFDRGNG